jgi:4-hydroxy-2-oxoheptanedioate aldolase
MDVPRNTFKQALEERRVQYGLWLGLVDPVCAEIAAGAGFDWLLIDQEHAPNDVRTVLAQLQAVAPYPPHAAVRPVEGSVSLIKQLLDIGAQTLLVPLVETPEQAARLVAAVRYPPRGIRGVGPSLARAAQWGRIERYLEQAEAEICLIVQVETAKGLGNLAQITAIEGVDAVFIGPSDLAASLGHPGNPAHPDVRRRIEDAIRTIAAAGKSAGLLATDSELARHYVKAGASFVAVGVDTSLLARATRQLAAAFKSPGQAGPEPKSGGY